MAQVVDVSGEGRDTRYSLKENHSELAFKHLLNSERVPAHHIALFFLRDFCIEAEEPSVERWIRQFQEEFGFWKDGKPNDAFGDLFSLSDDSEDSSTEPDDLFLECPEGEDDFDR